MLTLLFWYVIVSYLLGFVIFAVEVSRAIKEEKYHLVGFGIVLLFMAPLTTWHGVLHYLAVWWCRTQVKPFKPWI
jgi:hypothetical protein